MHQDHAPCEQQPLPSRVAPPPKLTSAGAAEGKQQDGGHTHLLGMQRTACHRTACAWAASPAVRCMHCWRSHTAAGMCAAAHCNCACLCGRPNPPPASNLDRGFMVHMLAHSGAHNNKTKCAGSPHHLGGSRPIPSTCQRTGIACVAGPMIERAPPIAAPCQAPAPLKIFRSSAHEQLSGHEQLWPRAAAPVGPHGAVALGAPSPHQALATGGEVWSSPHLPPKSMT